MTSSEKISYLLAPPRKNEETILLFGSGRLSGLLGHCQALKLVEKSQISFDAIYGSQLGAIFATMFAYGISHKVILDYIIHQLSAKRIFDYRINEFLLNSITFKPFEVDGICYGRRFAADIQRLFTFRKKPTADRLFIFAEHFNHSRLEIFEADKQYSALDCVRASNAFSALFPPVKLSDEFYIDSGIFGGLPLSQIYEHRLAKNKKLRRLKILAFQEGFINNLPELTITERIVNSFHEKIRYHSVKLELENVRELPIDLILISYDPRSLKHRSILKMKKTEKLHLTMQMEHIIHTQVDYYFHNGLGKSIKRRNRCAYYPIVQ